MRPFSVWYELGLLYTSRQEVLVQWIVDFQNKDHGHQVESKTQKLRRTQTVGLLWLRAPLFWPQRMSLYLFLMLRGSAHWPVLGQRAGEPRLDHVPVKSQDIHDSNQIDTGTCRVKNREWETHAGATQAAIAQQQGQAWHGHALGKKAGRVWFPVTTSCSTAAVVSRSLDRIRGVRNTGLVSSPSHFTAASLVLSSSRFG